MMLSDLNKESSEMEINENVRKAAIFAVTERSVIGHIEIPGYPGMYVSDEAGLDIVAISTFSEGGKQYIIGPLRSSVATNTL